MWICVYIVAYEKSVILIPQSVFSFDFSVTKINSAGALIELPVCFL